MTGREVLKAVREVVEAELDHRGKGPEEPLTSREVFDIRYAISCMFSKEEHAEVRLAKDR